MFGGIIDKIKSYLELKLDIYRLEVIERISIIMSFIGFMMIAMFMAVAIFIVVGLGLGLYIGGLIGSITGGYFITAGIYCLFMILLILLKKPILKALAGIFVDIFTHDLKKKVSDE